MENMAVAKGAMPTSKFWGNKRVFITGHTGFKGAWLTVLLNRLGATVKGYALEPDKDLSLYSQIESESQIESHISDVRNADSLKSSIKAFNPDIVFHLAAQSLVRESYKNPIGTYEVNLLGTVNLLDALRGCERIKSVIIVTTDKVYQNNEWVWSYREVDELGGFDPYSNSKACAELAVESYRNSFLSESGINVATVRAGNVIGGGDWAKDRLIPDILRSDLSGVALAVRYPNAVRPWQHVLEPLTGYLLLAEKLCSESDFSDSWNFGPGSDDVKEVSYIANYFMDKLEKFTWIDVSVEKHLHEAGLLRLDSSKASAKLNWHPKWNLDQSLERIVKWHNGYMSKASLYKLCRDDVEDYLSHVNN